MTRYPLAHLLLARGALAVLLLVPAACFQTAALGENKTMRAELDIFSGRPNPTWDLSVKEGEEFVKLLSKLPKADAGDIPEGLGYRGIVVSAGGKLILGFDSVAVCNGVVVGRRAGVDQKFTDKNCALERWLFRTGKGRLDKDLYDELNKAIKAGD
jgi:hypothetical protein